MRRMASLWSATRATSGSEPKERRIAQECVTRERRCGASETIAAGRCSGWFPPRREVTDRRRRSRIHHAGRHDVRRCVRAATADAVTKKPRPEGRGGSFRTAQRRCDPAAVRTRQDAGVASVAGFFTGRARVAISAFNFSSQAAKGCTPSSPRARERTLTACASASLAPSTSV